MIGKRIHVEEDGHFWLEAGEYCKHLVTGNYYVRPPETTLVGNLAAHSVIEHEDGTITVSPSILITGGKGEQWHGYLERGVWRKC